MTFAHPHQTLETVGQTFERQFMRQASRLTRPLSTGNVGIGTTTPAGNLAIAS